MVTSEPVREMMVALTRSMSAATSATSGSIDASRGLSKGTITATPRSTFAIVKIEHRNRKSASTGLLLTWTPMTRGVRQVAGIGADQRYRAGVGDRRAARRRQHPSSGAGPEHEHHRGFARHP